jgi:type III restriction enzyme
MEGPRTLPKELEAALHHLYRDYQKSFELWEQGNERGTPPVFIVVCQNTTISKMVFDWIAGYEQTDADGNTAIHSGNLPLFSNAREGAWIDRPNALLIDSAQLESGDAMSADFKKMAAKEIEEFKDELRERGDHRDEVTDEDLLREVMNTIGKRGKLGEQVRCVVSVSMLTEGWDANTVTHILGVRAFGTQLLCEQVVGRGLRRISYEPNADGMFEPEYAEVFGVPFSFIPTVGTAKPVVQKEIRRVYALPERADFEITFPRVIGYHWDMPTERLTAAFTSDSTMTLRTDEVPTRSQLDPIVGESKETTLDELKEATCSPSSASPMSRFAPSMMASFRSTSAASTSTTRPPVRSDPMRPTRSRRGSSTPTTTASHSSSATHTSAAGIGPMSGCRRRSRLTSIRRGGSRSTQQPPDRSRALSQARSP